MSDGIPCMWMRGGTSKGGYFLADDLSAIPKERDATLLRTLGSLDTRQIDGLGGADPLTCKVAVVRTSSRADVNVDYLFLQAFVDQPIVTDAQNCGNLLAGVGPFAIERGLVPAVNSETDVRIYRENTGKIAIARMPTPDGHVRYDGETRIDGVPGIAAPIMIEFRNMAGSTCGALLPTGHTADVIDGVDVTLIDNSMPCVVLHAADMAITGEEDLVELEANEALRRKLENIHQKAGPMMNLGDVKRKSVPKMTMISTPRQGGAIATRTFIPFRCHNSIGVLGAVGHDLAHIPEGTKKALPIEHPTGETTVIGHVDHEGIAVRTEALHTARKLFDGIVFAS